MPCALFILSDQLSLCNFRVEGWSECTVNCNHIVKFLIGSDTTSIHAIVDYFDAFLPNSLRVVKALTGDLAFTLRASLTTRWLRRDPVRLTVVRFFGFPITEMLLLF